MAVARAWEARVDNRFFEVGIAEAMAFMGNRCSRWVARHLVAVSSTYLLFPLSAKFIEPYLEQHSRPVIVAMGFIRAILPFLFSFMGSRIGRQLTYNTYKYANYRWKPVQGVNFNQNAGNYQDTVLDPELEELAHKVAVAIGHGQDPVETRSKMASLGFEVIGAGQGGYAVYRLFNEDTFRQFLIHMTPYGPGILDEMPRYLVLERKKMFNGSNEDWENRDTAILDAALPPEAAICGFSYSGAFFRSQEWAALTTRFEETLSDYSVACERLGTSPLLPNENSIKTPPTDLLSLKAFIRSGHQPKKKKKDKRRWKEIDAEVKKLSKLVSNFQKAGTAPKRVILYLEGLDCTAKSSTGGLICQALEECGYAVRTAQHNRPPTVEQRKKPWMDRCRFEYPEDVYKYGEEVPEYTALIWDRGPAGDFVYGQLSALDSYEKMGKYAEFQEYDERCRQEGVLFCKLLFVADKDSIAATLGKRLAHKKIARDLHTWLDANSFHQNREGLSEIESHIDPTDFVAFNNYKTNLSIFTDFARNTDETDYNNPWKVVNTCKRHPARMMLLKVFEQQLQHFAKCEESGRIMRNDGPSKLKVKGIGGPIPPYYIESKQQSVSVRAVLQSLLLMALVYFYAYITWNVDLRGYFFDDD